MDNLGLTELKTRELPTLALDLATHLLDAEPEIATPYQMGIAEGRKQAGRQLKELIEQAAHLSRLRRAEGVTVEQDWRAR